MESNGRPSMRSSTSASSRYFSSGGQARIRKSTSEWSRKSPRASDPTILAATPRAASRSITRAARSRASRARSAVRWAVRSANDGATSPLRRGRAPQARAGVDHHREAADDQEAAEQAGRRDALAEQEGARQHAGERHQEDEGDHDVDLVAPQEVVPDGVGQDVAGDGQEDERGPGGGSGGADRIELAALGEERDQEQLRGGVEGDLAQERRAVVARQAADQRLAESPDGGPGDHEQQRDERRAPARPARDQRHAGERERGAGDRARPDALPVDQPGGQRRERHLDLYDQHAERGW